MNIPEEHFEKLTKLFNRWSGEIPQSILILNKSGSNRKYYRILSENNNAIGVINDNINENRAFIEFTNTFLKNKFPVPTFYISDNDYKSYLIEDLGNTTLLDIRLSEPLNNVSKKLISYYESSLKFLLKFQLESKEIIDFKYCYPKVKMDKEAIFWDLNYFKYYFLKLKNLIFDEEKLEKDFSRLANLLLEVDQNYFMYRDFQSRNIMVHQKQLYFIDYQGGRKGALQYDLASILYQVKAQLPESLKERLLNYYLKELSKYLIYPKKDFLKYFYPYVFIRLIQVMGAYGYRGLIEKKVHFIESIPLVIKTLKDNYSKFIFLKELPELNHCIQQLINEQEKQKKGSNLTVHIKSFSYKSGIPIDTNEHGGGFVFDCRSLPNPGHFKKYMNLSGLDKETIQYLQNHTEVYSFCDHVFQLIEQVVENYIKREFTSLTINFGCTGGQHRSVFFAEALAKHLAKKYDINIDLVHTQKKNWKNYGD